MVKQSSTFGLYSAFLACSAIVFRSKRQSRLTVATMFLSSGMPVKPMFGREKHAQRQEEYSLQGRHDATHTRSLARSSSGRNRGVASCGILTLHRTVRLLALASFDVRRGRSKVTCTTWIGEGGGGSECLRLQGSFGMRDDCRHDVGSGHGSGWVYVRDDDEGLW
jgi:hypothetical protein